MSSRQPIKPYALALISFLVILAVAWQATRWSEWTVGVKSETGGILKWYVDTGDGFSEREGGYGPVPAGKRTEVRVLLPVGGIKGLRLDPVDSTGPVEVSTVKWDAPWPERSGRWDPRTAKWEGGDVIVREDSVVLVANEKMPDIRGTWNEVPGFSNALWWGFRLGFAGVMTILIFMAGYSWNFWVINTERWNHE